MAASAAAKSHTQLLVREPTASLLSSKVYLVYTKSKRLFSVSLSEVLNSANQLSSLDFAINRFINEIV